MSLLHGSGKTNMGYNAIMNFSDSVKGTGYKNAGFKK